MEGVPNQHPASSQWSRLGLGAGVLLARLGVLVRDSSPSLSSQWQEVRLRAPPPVLSSPGKSCPSPSPRPRSKQVGETQHSGTAGG